jgi:RES domain-containing protein
MIVLYRVSRARYAKDLSGEGARLAGGRWNYKGTPVIYTAESRSLAVLEAIVHMSQPDFLIKRKMVLIEIPETIDPIKIEISDLPKGWRKYPPPFKLAAIGTRWATSMQSLLLRVPSAVVPGEFNFLINPAHPDMKFVKIASVEDLVFDNRLNPEDRPGK